jgi:hypothetical protein
VVAGGGVLEGRAVVMAVDQDAERRWTVLCEFPGCDRALGTYPSLEALVAAAQAAGWRNFERLQPRVEGQPVTMQLCPKHAAVRREMIS